MPDKAAPIVLITHSLPNEWISSLDGKCNVFSGPLDATYLVPELVEHLGQAEGILTLLTISIDENILNQAGKLRVVSNMAVGVDNINIAACTRRHIPVGNTPGVLTESTADLTMALLLNIARNILVASQDARAGRWKTWSPAGWLGTELNGSTLGIIGMGKIGKAVAKRGRGFGMKILFSDPETKQETEAIQVPLDELLKQSDFISLHAPLIGSTRGMINRHAFSMMKPTAYLINAARGPLVDTPALLDALQNQRITGAALDVTDPEPLPPSHPLYSLPNCVIVPHIGSATQQTRRKMAELACENLLAGLKGERLPYCVNPEVYNKTQEESV
jgi:glyoxylate reductase